MARGRVVAEMSEVTLGKRRAAPSVDDSSDDESTLPPVKFRKTAVVSDSEEDELMDDSSERDYRQSDSEVETAVKDRPIVPVYGSVLEHADRSVKCNWRKRGCPFAVRFEPPPHEQPAKLPPSPPQTLSPDPLPFVASTSESIARQTSPQALPPAERDNFPLVPSPALPAQSVQYKPHLAPSSTFKLPTRRSLGRTQPPSDPSAFLPDLTAFLTSISPSLSPHAGAIFSAGISSFSDLVLFAQLDSVSRVEMYDEMSEKSGMVVTDEQVEVLVRALAATAEEGWEA
ncbi:hypothetical protein JCM8547_005496 [Rhodosporidiobolus lusitaniae]